MKIFFGESIVSKELLEEAGNKNKIKLEYYKIINEDKINRKEKSKFGISVIKKEYIENKMETEEKMIKHLSNDEKVIEKILKIFKENEVTPVTTIDIIRDIFCQYILA